MSENVITQTVYPKCYCKYEHTMCEFANDRGYCVKTGCTKRFVVNEVPKVNKNLVEVVRCKDCKHWDDVPIADERRGHECHLIDGNKYKIRIATPGDWYCPAGKEKTDKG